MQNAISAAGTDADDARYVPPPVREMIEAMNELERYIGLRPEDPPLLVQLALIHYQFEAIHPFMDGNGRIGRLLIPLLLHERQHLPQPLLYLSGYFEAHRDAYKDHLLRVSQTGEWEPWIRFFLGGVVEQSRAAIQITDRLLELWGEYRATASGPRAPSTLLKIIDGLFAQPAVSAASVSERLGVTPKTAYSLIGRLEELGILREATGRAYGRIYIASGVIQATVPD